MEAATTSRQLHSRARPARPRQEGGCHASRNEGTMVAAVAPAAHAAPLLKWCALVITPRAEWARTVARVAPRARSLIESPPARPDCGSCFGKGRAAPPPPWFPPLDPPFRGAPTRKGIPRGGNPSPHALIGRRATRAGRVGPLGEDRAPHGPRGARARHGSTGVGLGSRPLQIGSSCGSHPPPSRGAP
jgi:hypothetical protein